MGDIAEWLIEQGEDAWLAHKLGQCDDVCQYCEEESRESISEGGHMDTRTGMILPVGHIPIGQKGHFVEIKLYSPCACGSGKKFKFCCKKSA